MNKKTIGFDAEAKKLEKEDQEILKKVNAEDLLKYGLIPELVGRLPVISTLHELDQKALIKILTRPKNALVKQYHKLFEMEGVALEFTEEALNQIAKIAINQKTGARGLRTIMENIMLEIMYELPDLQNVKECLISREVIMGEKDPVYVFDEINSNQSA